MYCGNGFSACAIVPVKNGIGSHTVQPAASHAGTGIPEVVRSARKTADSAMAFAGFKLAIRTFRHTLAALTLCSSLIDIDRVRSSREREYGSNQ